MREVLEAALEAEERGEPAALVTVVSTKGSTPQKAGARMPVSYTHLTLPTNA